MKRSGPGEEAARSSGRRVGLGLRQLQLQQPLNLTQGLVGCLTLRFL